MLCPMVKGMQEYGMGATAKHFSGDGVDYRDQHYSRGIWFTVFDQFQFPDC